MSQQDWITHIIPPSPVTMQTTHRQRTLSERERDREDGHGWLPSKKKKSPAEPVRQGQCFVSAKVDQMILQMLHYHPLKRNLPNIFSSSETIVPLLLWHPLQALEAGGIEVAAPSVGPISFITSPSLEKRHSQDDHCLMKFGE